MSDYLFFGFGLVAIVLAFVVAKAWKPNVSKPVELGAGLVALFVSAYFFFGVESRGSVPEGAGISAKLIGGLLLAGAVLLVLGVVMIVDLRLSAGLQLGGAILLLLVVALPSPMLFAAPLFGMVAIHSVNRWHATGQEQGATPGATAPGGHITK